jgi:CheY-like chemotaxis protein
MMRTNGDGGSPGPRRDKVDVLVVEDNFEALQAIVEFLREQGFGAVGAVNGDVALAVLKAKLRPSLILLDLSMPAMDGWEFCRILESEPELADLPVAVVSALAAPAHELPRRRNNAGYILKPIDFDRLLSTVKDHCVPADGRRRAS